MDAEYVLSALTLIFLVWIGYLYIAKHLRRGKISFVFHSGGIADEEFADVQAALKRLNRPMLRDGVEIHFREGDDPHLGMTWMGTKAGGHLCNLELNRICLGMRDVTFRVVCHEVAHLHHLHLIRECSDFSEEWLTIHGDVYVPDPTLPIRDGILTVYGRGNLLEDVAEWVSECYPYLHTRRSLAITANPEVKKDFRYRVKLALLYRYEFLSKADYHKLKPLFEPKNK